MPPNDWTREQLLVALTLYWQIPFGRFDQHNPEVISYAKLIGRTPSALAMRLSNWASLDPAITSTGRTGLSGISKAARELWDEVHQDWERFGIESEQAALALGIADSSAEIEAPANELASFVGGARVAQVMVRIGQNLFRSAVLNAYRGRCCITGLSTPSLLNASHIVPWRVDTDNRLNPRNGLCLSVLHDRAFDAGIITIAENMTVHVSTSHARTRGPFFQSAIASYEGHPIELPEKFQPDPQFLDYHRQHVFQA